MSRPIGSCCRNPGQRLLVAATEPNDFRPVALLRCQIEDRVFLREKNRAIRQVAKAPLVFGERQVGFLTFGSLKRGNQVIWTIPPDLGDPIVGWFGSARLLGIV